MKKFFTWAKGFLSEGGEASSKRLVGVLSGITLCSALFLNQTNH